MKKWELDFKTILLMEFGKKIGLDTNNFICFLEQREMDMKGKGINCRVRK